MRIVSWSIGAGLALVGFVACGGGGAPDTRRLDGLEKRLDALEQRLTATAASAESVDRLVNDAASLDRRLSAIETGVRELAARAPAAVAAPTAASPTAGSGAPATPPYTQPSTGPGAGTGRPTRLERGERRAQLRALSDEFRTRIADLRNQGGDDRQEETRQLLEWYREQRRAVLRGGGRTDQ